MPTLQKDIREWELATQHLCLLATKWLPLLPDPQIKNFQQEEWGKPTLHQALAADPEVPF